MGREGIMNQICKTNAREQVETIVVFSCSKGHSVRAYLESNYYLNDLGLGN